MKKLFVATSVALLLSAPLTFSEVRPLADSSAWLDYQTMGMTEDQIWFSKNL
jgi:hypothetical protein